MDVPDQDGLIEAGRLNFTVESRILRELGERLVKQPEVALLELIKNSYDADSTYCAIRLTNEFVISVSDDGCGMTLAQFKEKWMRVGTSSKAVLSESPHYGRRITGEKGIGRFAVRFLGSSLKLISIADDEERNERTRLTVDFDWPSVDRAMDLNQVSVPYILESVDAETPLGTQLEISELRIDPTDVDWHQIRTGVMSVVSPIQALYKKIARSKTSRELEAAEKRDPGFDLRLSLGEEGGSGDLAEAMLNFYVLRAEMSVVKNQVSIKVFERDQELPILKVTDTFKNEISPVQAELRFLPRRKGTFEGAPVDGRRAYTWVAENSGVAVFDRNFRVLPYGTPGDDWLHLSADSARRERDPNSEIAKKHFKMSQAEYSDPGQNWMLRLPSSLQVIGLVQVEGLRNANAKAKGLIASADREGFVANEAFQQLYQVVRGAAELIAVADRMIQKRDEEILWQIELESSRENTREAIAEIEQAEFIPPKQKKRVIEMLVDAQDRLERQEQTSAEKESQLEVMSLLGVVAGYMTHEFGVAMQDLKEAEAVLRKLALKDRQFKKSADDLKRRIERLEEFGEYTRIYVRGTRQMPAKPFPVLPRVRHVLKLLGTYAKDRGIEVETEIDTELEAPLVPASLYNGILQNLYTNALKAITTGRELKERSIAFRAWNDNKWHYLQVSDSGVGIPSSLQERVFDPLFSTTEMNADPLGSGMGLGLSLLQRAVRAFNGHIELIAPPPGYSTCVQVRLPSPRKSP